MTTRNLTVVRLVENHIDSVEIEGDPEAGFESIGRYKHGDEAAVKDSTARTTKMASKDSMRSAKQMMRSRTYMPNPESQTMANEQSNENEGGDENVPIRHVQTARVRYDDQTGQFKLTLTPAIRAAGLDQNAMFRFIPEEVDNLGLVPALGSKSGTGNLRDERTYSVSPAGAAGEVLRLQIPEDALDALGIDTDAAKEDEAPLLDVFAGDRMIAFDKSNAIAIPVEILPDDYESETERDEIILEQIQTTTPRVRSGGTVTATITPAIKRAGGGDGDDMRAVEYFPEFSDGLGGIVPAVTRKYGDGRAHGDERSLWQENERGVSASLPDDVLAALGLSTDDYEDAPLEERPPLTVYAGDHLLAFGRPGERNVTVDRGQTPVEPTPSLTDIDGIGPALADRLPDEGYETVEDLADATREDLLAIPSLGKRRARLIMADVTDRMNKRGDER